MSHFTIPRGGLFGAAALLAVAAGGVVFTISEWRRRITRRYGRQTAGTQDPLLV
jgi:hypothetical protein